MVYDKHACFSLFLALTPDSDETNWGIRRSWLPCYHCLPPWFNSITLDNYFPMCKASTTNARQAKAMVNANNTTRILSMRTAGGEVGVEVGKIDWSGGCSGCRACISSMFSITVGLWRWSDIWHRFVRCNWWARWGGGETNSYYYLRCPVFWSCEYCMNSHTVLHSSRSGCRIYFWKPEVDWPSPARRPSLGCRCRNSAWGESALSIFDVRAKDWTNQTLAEKKKLAIHIYRNFLVGTQNPEIAKRASIPSKDVVKLSPDVLTGMCCYLIIISN